MDLNTQWTLLHIETAAAAAGLSESDIATFKANLVGRGFRLYPEGVIYSTWYTTFPNARPPERDERFGRLIDTLRAGPSAPSRVTYARTADMPEDLRSQVAPTIQALIDEGRYEITDHGSQFVVHPSHDFHYLTREEYLVQLRRHRDYIASGAELNHDDNNTMGNKSTSASWGLCSDKTAPELWPEMTLRVFPIGHLDPPSTRHNNAEAGDMCPFDARTRSDGNGCIHKCRIFRPPHVHPRPSKKELRVLSAEEKRERRRRAEVPTREEALRLYDEAIAKAEARFARIADFVSFKEPA